MKKFSIKRKGYSIEEVDEFLRVVECDNRRIFDEKSIRIDELKCEVIELQKDIAEFKRRENNVNQALVTAVEKSNEIELATKKRFELEGERLKLFREKWVNYCDSTAISCQINTANCDVIDKLHRYEQEFYSMFQEGINLKKTKEFDNSNIQFDEVNNQYIDESNRIINLAKSNNNQSLHDISLDEINEKNIAQLCKELGII